MARPMLWTSLTAVFATLAALYYPTFGQPHPVGRLDAPVSQAIAPAIRPLADLPRL